MTDQRDLAVVVEGGGMRGAYAAGALVAVHDGLADRIGGLFATSSGAGSAAYLAAGQREGLDIWRDHLHGGRLIHPARFLLGGAALDVDYLIDTVFGRRIPLEVDAVRRYPGVFEVTATRADTGEAAYLDLHHVDVFSALRAATSLPGAVRRGVVIDGIPYVDGGLVTPIPIQRAFAHGFREIVVVLTRPAEYRKRPVGRVGRWLVARDFPALGPIVDDQHLRYREALALVESPPPGVNVTLIRPGPRVDLSRWTRSREKLLAGIDAGLVDARRLVGRLQGASSRARNPIG